MIDAKLEIDYDRGVIYVHDKHGSTLLRICNLPTPIPLNVKFIDITNRVGSSYSTDVTSTGVDTEVENGKELNFDTVRSAERMQRCERRVVPEESRNKLRLAVLTVISISATLEGGEVR